MAGRRIYRGGRRRERESAEAEESSAATTAAATATAAATPLAGTATSSEATQQELDDNEQLMAEEVAALRDVANRPEFGSTPASRFTVGANDGSDIPEGPSNRTGGAQSFAEGSGGSSGSTYGPGGNQGESAAPAHEGNMESSNVSAEATTVVDVFEQMRSGTGDVTSTPSLGDAVRPGMAEPASGVSDPRYEEGGVSTVFRVNLDRDEAVVVNSPEYKMRMEAAQAATAAREAAEAAAKASEARAAADKARREAEAAEKAAEEAREEARKAAEKAAEEAREAAEAAEEAAKQQSQPGTDNPGPDGEAPSYEQQIEFREYLERMSGYNRATAGSGDIDPNENPTTERATDDEDALDEAGQGLKGDGFGEVSGGTGAFTGSVTPGGNTDGNIDPGSQTGQATSTPGGYLQVQTGVTAPIPSPFEEDDLDATNRYDPGELTLAPVGTEEPARVHGEDDEFDAE